MTNKNRTKRAMLFSVLALVLCMSMFVGTTYAWFTDSVTSAKNQIVAGNLDVALKYQNKAVTSWTDVEGKSDLFDPNALWEPGHVEVAYFEVSNVGSLAMKYLFALNVYGETEGVNVAGEEFKLSDYLYYGLVEDVQPGALVTRDDAITAVANPKKLSDAIDDGNNRAVMGGNMEKGAAAKYVAIVIWMPTTVGNEANYRGVNVPTVEIGVSLIATQWDKELDSFGPDYDAGAKLPEYGTGSGIADANGRIEVEIRSAQGGKLGVAYTDETATDDGKLEIAIEKLPAADLDHADGNIVLSDVETAVSYEITATGLKAGNTEEIEVWLRVEDSSKIVALYHNGTKIDFTRAGYEEYIIFITTSFSPFTVVYGKPEVSGGTVAPEAVQAVVTKLPEMVGVAKNDWATYDILQPNYNVDAKPALEAAYKFALPTNYEDTLGQYGDWACDFYVSLDRDLSANQIFLAGSYDLYANGAWVGFHNGDYTLKAGNKVGLMATFLGTDKPAWTYEMVADLVGEFRCGVGDVNNALSGATFTVELLLIDPKNENNTIVAAVEKYTFN